MIWYSVLARLVVIVLVLGGCAAETTVETQVVVVAETEACSAARQLQPPPLMNAYQGVLFALDEMPEDEREVPCRRCLIPGECEVIEKRCGCGGPRLLTTSAINRGLEGLRFRALDPGRQYCVAFAAFGIPELTTGEMETRECACDFAGVDLTGRSRMCGLSPFPGSVAENAPAFIVAAECTGNCPSLAEF